jgi:Uncharacterized protein conserved in bacteria
MCHDIIGPISIAAAIDDLRDADNGIDQEGIAIVAESARTAAARLAFYRFAFGQKLEGETRVASLVSLLKGALTSKRLDIDWPMTRDGQSGGEPSIPTSLARLILCLALIATEALPRGGVVSVQLSRDERHFNAFIEATGDSARTPAPTLDAYNADGGADLTPRTAVGYYAGELARRVNAILEVDYEPVSSIALKLTVPRFG